MKDLPMVCQEGRISGVDEGVVDPGQEALVWFKKAADQGMVEDQATLGDMYFMAAEHVARDFGLAAHWLEKAAEGG